MSARANKPNVVLIEGPLKFDPRVNDRAGRGGVVNFMVAVPTGYKDHASGIRCVAWGGQYRGDNAAQLQAGDYVRIEGRIAARAYENKDKVKVESVEVTVDALERVAHKSQAKAPGQTTANHEPAGDDDLPF